LTEFWGLGREGKFAAVTTAVVGCCSVNQREGGLIRLSNPGRVCICSVQRANETLFPHYSGLFSVKIPKMMIHQGATRSR
ncbi:hypothetical protein RvY_08817, partial [Ramazzottius varieornatus]